MIDRRTFVCSAAASLAAVRLQAQAPRNIENAIDAHVHVWGKPDPAFPLAAEFSEADRKPATFTPDELLAQCKPNGVNRVVLIQMNFFGFDNSYMLSCIKNHPGVFSGVAVIDEKKSDAADTMKLLAKQGVRGFRLYADKANAESWLKSDAMQTMWSTGEKTGQAMCLLSNPDALPAIDKLCERFPKTTVVIDHFSRIGMKGTVNDDELAALFKLARFANVYVKTSAFYALGSKKAPYTDLGDMIRKLRDTFGASRLMWASDCPYQVQGEHTYAASIELVRDRLDFLSEDDKQWMLRKTAERVFFS